MCETAYGSDEVSDDVPNCRIVTERQCDGDDCRDVPRQECDINQKVNGKLSKTTECKSVPRKVCGPEACPIVKRDPICRNEIKTVRLESTYLQT